MKIKAPLAAITGFVVLFTLVQGPVAVAVQKGQKHKIQTKAAEKAGSKKPTNIKRRPSLKAHVHDKAIMNIVTSGNSVHTSLEVPSHNVFGFEHTPNNDKQKTVVKDKLKLLRETAAKFIVFKDDFCKPEKTVVESSIESIGAKSKQAHSDVDIKVHYKCKRAVDDQTIKVETLKYLNLKQLRLNILSDKFTPAVTITDKSHSVKV